MRPAALILTHTRSCALFPADALYRIGACSDAVPHALDRRLLSTGKSLSQIATAIHAWLLASHSIVGYTPDTFLGHKCSLKWS